MQFQVPGAVLTQIAEYDPSQPKPVTPPPTRPFRNTLGLVNDLFPLSIVPQDVQDGWATYMNAAANPDRHRTHITDQVYALLIVSRSIWFGLWQTKPGHPEHGQYVYGFSIAHRSSEAALAKVGTLSFPSGASLESVAPYTSVKYGGVSMRKYSKTFTEKEIADLKLRRLPNFILLESCSAKHTALNRFSEAFTVKNWSDIKHNPFNRIVDIAHPGDLIREFSGLSGDTSSSIFQHSLKAHRRIAKVLSTPFFRRVAAQTQSEFMDILHKSDSRKDSESILRKYFNRLYAMDIFALIYGEDAPLDYFQRLWKSVLNYRYGAPSYLYREDGTAPYLRAIEWFRANVPVSSYVNMAEKDGEHLPDTFYMTGTLLSYEGMTLQPPKRWRATEFHDLVNGELFKVRNPNMELPQDLFPAPIKVDSYTFFQPKDTHQLFKWGLAVHNCVGNSSTYADGVKRKKEFIVLAMENGSPRFTIQLDVKGGVMEVTQIVGMCNKPLDAVERADYTDKFAKALKIREAQIVGEGK